MNGKIKVRSTVGGEVSVLIPEINLKRSWDRKGTIRYKTLEELEQGLYDPGFEYMIRQGILEIMDLDAKKELGLEPEDATEDVNIIVLSEEEMKRYLTVMPLPEFKEKIVELPKEQVQNLVDYAISNEIVNMDKNDVLKEVAEVNVIKAIELRRKSKED